MKVFALILFLILTSVEGFAQLPAIDCYKAANEDPSVLVEFKRVANRGLTEMQNLETNLTQLCSAVTNSSASIGCYKAAALDTAILVQYKATATHGTTLDKQGLEKTLVNLCRAQ